MLILVPPLNLITVILLGEIGVMTVERLTPSVGRMLSDKNLCESDGTGSLPSLQGTFFFIRLTISVIGRPSSDGGHLIPGLNW